MLFAFKNRILLYTRKTNKQKVCFMYTWVYKIHSRSKRFVSKQNFINRDEFEYQTWCSCLSPSLHTVRTAHTSGLTHQTMVSCEAFTNAQLRTSTSGGGDKANTTDPVSSGFSVCTQIYSTKYKAK